MQILTKLYRGLIVVGDFLKPLFLLGVRLFWGWQFLKTGLGKFGDIHAIANYFQSLSIPAPLLNAYLAAGTEVVCGFLLLIGFASRLASIPLMITMSVALLTAHRTATLAVLDDPVTFVNQLPFTFLFAVLTIFVFGPGMFSIDALIKRFKG